MPRSIASVNTKAALGIVSLLLLVAFGLFFLKEHGPLQAVFGSSSEVRELTASPPKDFVGYQDYFEKLAKEKGAVYAYGVLRHAPVPPGIDTHLLGHYIGYVLYDQKGIAGITDCTQEFRNACSHSMVISAFREFGTQALADIVAACRQAPGGRGAYPMCFHGLGHGVLAYAKYDFEKSLAICKEAADAGADYEKFSASSGPESARFVNAWYECIGGATMEMTSGIHDKKAWGNMVPKYMPKSDVLMPCDAAFMPKETRPICYTYLTERLFEEAGATRGENSGDEIYRKAFSFCAQIPPDQSENRNACYGGIGKDFVGFVNGGDIRNVASASDAALLKIHEQCGLAPDEDARKACLSSALSSLFWGGENDPKAALSFCRLTPGPAERSGCYDELVRNAFFFLGGTPQIGAVCRGLPEPQRDFCFINGNQ